MIPVQRASLGMHKEDTGRSGIAWRLCAQTTPRVASRCYLMARAASAFLGRILVVPAEHDREDRELPDVGAARGVRSRRSRR